VRGVRIFWCRRRSHLGHSKPLYVALSPCFFAMSAFFPKQTFGATTGIRVKANVDVAAVWSAPETVKCVAGTCRQIKTGWGSPRRVARLGMAAAWNGHAPDHGASNLLLLSSGRSRVALMLRRRIGRNDCKCEHNGDNHGCYWFHHSYTLLRSDAADDVRTTVSE
jgi:hypothetical protein